jgi:hypothetical protein
MDTSATPSPSKQVRFHNLSNATADTPAAQMKLLIRQGLASLDKAVAAFFLQFPIKLFTNRLRNNQKLKALNKLDTQHVPSSLRFKLLLNSSIEVKSKPEFKELAATFNSIILSFQNQSKAIFKEVLQLKIDDITEDSISTFIHFCDSLINYFTLMEKRPGPLPAANKHAILLAHIHTGTTASLQIDNNSFIHSINAQYINSMAQQEETPTSSDSDSLPSVNSPMDTSSSSTQPNIQSQIINHNAISNNVASIIKACVKHPLQAYTDFVKTTSFKQKLSKFVAHEISKTQLEEAISFINNLQSDNNTTLHLVVVLYGV